MILFASQPDCYLTVTHKVTGIATRDLFLGEDTNGVWRVGDEFNGPRPWGPADGMQFPSRDLAIAWLERTYVVEIVR